MQKEPISHQDRYDAYQPVDDFSQLTFAEQLALWSLRYWADCHKKEHSPYEALGQAYRLAKTKEAMVAFDGFMSVLVVGLYRQMDVRCLKCDGISDDEKIILTALALEQQGDSQESQNLIGRLIAPSALRIAQNMLTAWASNLAQAKHRVIHRAWGVIGEEPAENWEIAAYYNPATVH